MSACSVTPDSLRPMDYSLPGSSVRGISQARILEWVATSSSRGSSWPKNWTCVSSLFCTGGLSCWATWLHSNATGSRENVTGERPLKEPQQDLQTERTEAWASLLVQELRICLAMQIPWFDPWSGKIPPAVGASKPMSHSYWERAPQEKSAQWETCPLQF